MNNNIDENTMNEIKNLVDNGNISEAISHISPEIIESFSKIMNSENLNNSKNANSFKSSKNTYDSNNSNKSSSSNKSNNFKNQNNSGNSSNFNNSNNSNNSSNFNSSSNYNKSNSTNNNNFDFSKLDMNTILKMKSVMEKMNDKNDPRYNLLYSLKPYLRHTRQDKLEQYVNLLNFSKVADILKNDKKDDKNV